MANIRIDLVATVINGQTLTFKSPVDCSHITGLIVYYPEGDTTTSKTFQFADAHGNNVGSVSLFAENVLVKVILDTELNRAYVQNADTNAYLEEKFTKCTYRNLLDNSDFRNPINQRGLTQYRGSTNAIDRWVTGAGTCVLDVKDGYISMTLNTNSGSSSTQTIRQELREVSRYIGKTLTFVAKVRGTQVRLLTEGIEGSAGTYKDYPDWTVICINVYVPAGTTFIKPTIQCPKGYNWDCEWCALYEGVFTTENMPEYKPKGYAQELLNCSQYNPETGEWQPWEYVNPPMIIGVEYCTPERWGGVPVYRRRLSLGNLPASKGELEVPVGVTAGKCVCISLWAYSSSKNLLLPIPYTEGSYVCGYSYNGENINISVTDGFSGYAVFGEIKYIK